MNTITFFSLDCKKKNLIPLYQSPVHAGFPSPAEDYIEKKLDLNELIITHPAATFFVRVEGESMSDAHIFSGDILVVNRALTPKNGSIIVAILNGEFTVKRFFKKKNKLYLYPENKQYSPIQVQEKDSFEVWGVISYIIHQAK